MSEALEKFICPNCGKKFHDGSDFTVMIFDSDSDLEIRVECCGKPYNAWISPGDFYQE